MSSYLAAFTDAHNFLRAVNTTPEPGEDRDWMLDWSAGYTLSPSVTNVSYQSRDRQQISRNVLHTPSIMHNRGVVSIAARSVVGVGDSAT